MKRRLPLLPNWRRLARRAWSIRLALLASALYAVDVGVSLYASAKPSPALAALAGLCSLAAAVARLIPQKGLRDGD